MYEYTYVYNVIWIFATYGTCLLELGLIAIKPFIDSILTQHWYEGMVFCNTGYHLSLLMMFYGSVVAWKP